MNGANVGYRVGVIRRRGSVVYGICRSIDRVGIVEVDGVRKTYARSRIFPIVQPVYTRKDCEKLSLMLLQQQMITAAMIINKLHEKDGLAIVGLLGALPVIKKHVDLNTSYEIDRFMKWAKYGFTGGMS